MNPTAKTVADFFRECTPKERLALAALEKHRGTSLQNANPYEERFSGTPGGEGSRVFLESNFPEEAAGMKAKSAGFVSSLGAVMYDLGETELTKEIHQEKMESDPIYQVQKKKQAEDWEQQMLAKMSEAADKMAAARGYDPNSKVSNGNYGKFRRYFNELNQQQALDAQV